MRNYEPRGAFINWLIWHCSEVLKGVACVGSLLSSWHQNVCLWSIDGNKLNSSLTCK